jgi:hypothetical protein
LDQKFRRANGTLGHLAIYRQEEEVLGQRFRSRDAASFAKPLKPYIDAIWKNPKAYGSKTAKQISLADAVQLCG